MTEAIAGPVVQWQYAFVNKQTENYLLNELNNMGLGGWEVLSINFAIRNRLWFFQLDPP